MRFYSFGWYDIVHHHKTVMVSAVASSGLNQDKEGVRIKEHNCNIWWWRTELHQTSHNIFINIKMVTGIINASVLWSSAVKAKNIYDFNKWLNYLITFVNGTFSTKCAWICTKIKCSYSNILWGQSKYLLLSFEHKCKYLAVRCVKTCGQQTYSICIITHYSLHYSLHEDVFFKSIK